MWTKEWDSSYVGFTTDGADWLVQNTNIKFVGKNFFSSGVKGLLAVLMNQVNDMC
jgi:hypothetical protein